MSGRKIKRTARGFLNAASRIVPGARSLFQGSSSSHSRQEALLRHARPKLCDTSIALQRSTDVNVYVIDLICQSLIYKCVLHVSISCPYEEEDEEEEVQHHEEEDEQAHEEEEVQAHEEEEEVTGIDVEADDDTTEDPVVR
jgi:hypothetical protein